MRIENVRQVTVTNVEFSDYRLGLGFSDINKQTVVNNEKAPMRILNYGNYYQFSVTFE